MMYLSEGRQVYRFQAKLDEGESFERQLDGYFAHWFHIQPGNKDQQRRGIDRIFTDQQGRVFTVQYKSDSTAAQTGNAFIETISVDHQNKRGWAYTCEAQILIYYIPPTRTLYVLSTVDLKQMLERWTAEHTLKIIPNEGYNTIGAIVPLKELRAIAKNTISLKKEPRP